MLDNIDEKEVEKKNIYFLIVIILQYTKALWLKIFAQYNDIGNLKVNFII